MYKEKDIIREGQVYWVLKVNDAKFEVLKKDVTHSQVVEAYADESIAIARMEYLDRKVE